MLLSAHMKPGPGSAGRTSIQGSTYFFRALLCTHSLAIPSSEMFHRFRMAQAFCRTLIKILELGGLAISSGNELLRAGWFHISSETRNWRTFNNHDQTRPRYSVQALEFNNAKTRSDCQS